MLKEEIASNVYKTLDENAVKKIIDLATAIIENLLPKIENLEQQTATNYQTINYNKAGLDMSAPLGGWLSSTALRAKHRAMTEAIAVGKYEQGFVMALSIVALLG